MSGQIELTKRHQLLLIRKETLIAHRFDSCENLVNRAVEMALLDFDPQPRPEARESARRAAKHRGFVAFHVNLDEADRAMLERVERFRNQRHLAAIVAETTLQTRLERTFAAAAIARNTQFHRALAVRNRVWEQTDIAAAQAA